MKKQKNKNLLSLSKKRIANLNHEYTVYGGTGGNNQTGGETTTFQVPDTYEIVCVDNSKRYELRPKGKNKPQGTVVDETV